MHTDTYNTFREAGFDEKQAVVLATAIPDVDQPIKELRSEMDHRSTELRNQLAEFKLKIVTGERNQTRLLAGLLVAVLLAVIASNFF